MRMLLAFTAATLAATPAIAAEPAEGRFTHDGYTYVYKSVEKDGRKVITGRRFPGSTPFRLVVSGDRVSGVTNGVRVAFKLNEVERLDSVERLAAR